MSTGYIMTLANSIIGVGILAMPFCFLKCGVLLSILLLAMSNLITRLSCYYPEDCKCILDPENKPFLNKKQSHSDSAHYIPEHRFKYITISMVLVALFIGILIPSIELVIGLVGSTIGVAICIMFPASCFIKINKKNSTEKLAAQFLLVFGFLIMILGTYANLGAIDEQKSGANVEIERKPDNLINLQDVASPPIQLASFNVPNEKEANKLSADDNSNSAALSNSQPKPLDKPLNAPDTIQEINLTAKENSKKILSNPKSQEQQFEKQKILQDESIKNVDPKEQPPNVINNENSIEIQKNEEVDQLMKPIAAAKQSDSLINKDALQKEDQEIAIDAKEHEKIDIERTKEIIAEVKNELAKQNEAAQKEVLEKIDKISKKVNSIEQMQKNELDENKNKIDNLNKFEAKEDIPDESNVKKLPDDDRSLKSEKLSQPSIPIAKFLADQNVDLSQNQQNPANGKIEKPKIPNESNKLSK